MEINEKIKDGKKVTIIIKKEIDITNFSYEAFLNLPEYSLSLECDQFDYEGMNFTFIDPEDGKEHKLDRNKIEIGMEKFLNQCIEGKHGEYLSDLLNLFDLGYWDATVMDNCIQICLFNEIVFG